MIIVTQTVLAAAQFTGAAGAGLVTFLEGNSNPPQESGGAGVPLLLWCSLDLVTGGNPAEVDFELRDPSLTTSIIRIGGSTIDTTGAKGVTRSATVAGCRLPIPRANLSAQWYELRCLTSLKTGDGTLTVVYSYGPEVGA